MVSRSGTCNKSNNRVKKFGLSEAERLKQQVVKQLFAKGNRFHCGQLTIIYLRSNKQAVGFVASKKIGCAVERNKVKRRIREAYRMNKEIFRGLQVIFYAQHPLNSEQILNIIRKFQEH